MKTIELEYAGETVALPDMPRYAKFYRKLAAGAWEPATFAVLARNLGPDVVYLDIGSWIGVTPFWASRRAKAVIAVEPDPECLAILEALAPAYPNVSVVPGALSTDPQVTLRAVDGFGSSETSILAIGDGDSTVVPGLSLVELLKRAGEDPVFVKIDIEGYEFAIAEELAGLRNPQVIGLQLAVHPQLFERTCPGNRLMRRLRTVWAVWQLGRALGGFFPSAHVTKYGSLMNYIVRGVVFRANSKGADFVFERPRNAVRKESA